MKFEIYKEPLKLSSLSISPTAGQWRWRLRAANGEAIASGESYHNKQDCLHAIDLIKETTVLTPVVETQN